VPPTLRVASVPAGHPYVRHLDDPDADDRVLRLPDPVVAGAPAGQWWPSPWLESDWVRAHADRFDLLHIHFGFDDRSADQLRRLVGALRHVGAPLVVTVHDLRNPHHRDPRPHADALDVLVPEADALITLTGGAAAEIDRRWGRPATVIPHPHLVDLDRMAEARPSHDGFVVGLHAKSERANNDSVRVARVLADAVARLPGATLRVDAHDDVPGRAVAAALDGVDVRVHARFSDAELWDYLSGLDLSVLPYRFATHSGWLEACRDLGTTVLAPDCGYLHEQGACLVYHRTGSGPDPVTVREAVEAAFALRPALGTTPSRRAAQRREIARSHRRVYDAALARRRPT
jgi:glycosyltransferase involved in cell wall biosynthesis